MKSMLLAAILLGGLICAPAQADPAPPSGPAPDFTGISAWLNSPALTMVNLKGKVVLVDFWTYSCINCIRTLPYVEKWYETYKDKGLVVVGVHAPEFAFEKKQSNVETAIKRFGITYPVALDSDLATWRAYHNQYWPAEYLVDRQGNIVHSHFGEGEYDKTEKEIQKLLQVDMPVEADQGPDLASIRSPEMYLGSDRERYQAPGQKPVPGSKTYSLPSGKLPANTYALDGAWTIKPSEADLTSTGKISLSFNSGKVHIVATADSPVTLDITVDGKPQPPVKVEASELYTLFEGAAGPHDLLIKSPAGLKMFTFTFG